MFSRLRTANEVFADRTYQPDGSLTSRSRQDALIQSPEGAVAQVIRMVRDGQVVATNGTLVPITADTVCLHGDGPKAVQFALSLRQALQAAGVDIKGLTSP